MRMHRAKTFVAAPTRLMLRQPANNARERCICAARVDASTSKRKLTRMPKLELQTACEELGIDTEGTKPVLVANIMAHFAADAPAEAEPPAKTTRIIMNQSAAKAPPAPAEPAAQPIVVTGDKREDLAARVRALDSTITERTMQLEELRNTDKQTVEALLEDHEALKTHFQRNLETVSAAMDDVVELQASYSKLAEMQSEQAELKDMVDTLKRLLEQREREVDRLSTQLQEMRSRQAKEAEERASERLAMLALTSQVAVAAGDSSAPAAPYPSAGATALMEAPVGFDAGSGSGDSSNAITSLNAAMAMPAAIRADGQAIPADKVSDVFGPGLPGLVACDVGRNMVGAYATVRDALLQKAWQKAASDATAIATVAVTLYMAAMQ